MSGLRPCEAASSILSVRTRAFRIELTDAMDLNFNAQQIALRLAVAAAVGMLIGFERESQHKGVGIRTFSLTSLLGTICALLGNNFALEGMGVITVLTIGPMYFSVTARLFSW